MKKCQSIRKITKQITKKVSHATIWRSLNSNVVIRRKIKRKTTTTEILQGSSSCMGKECHVLKLCREKYIASGREKNYLDGLDGNNYYWRDLRQAFCEFFSRKMRGGSLMVWGTFSCGGKCNLQKVD